MSESSKSVSPADSQLEMARTRTVLAMDRTLLAWVRTSISLSVFGFTLAKVVHTLIVNGSLTGINSAYPKHLGVFLMTLGIICLLCGAYDYRTSLRRLSQTVDMPSITTTLIISFVLALFNFILMVFLVKDIN
jgi:putative membrane protein